MIVITNPAINPNLGSFPSTVGGEMALQGMLKAFITLGLIAGGLIFFFMLLWGGFEYATSGGDKEATQKAGKRITNAFIGLVLVLVSFAIIKLVGAIFGINLIEFNIPTIS